MTPTVECTNATFLNKYSLINTMIKTVDMPRQMEQMSLGLTPVETRATERRRTSDFSRRKLPGRLSNIYLF